MVNSTLYDSEDENQINVSESFQSAPEKFSEKIQTLGERTKYPVTAILTELSNRILLDAQIDDIYQKYKDPLQFQVDGLQNKVNLLKGDKELSRNTINYLTQFSLDANSNLPIDKDQLITDHKQKVCALEKKESAYINELSKLQLLQMQRDRLVTGDPHSNALPLKGAFQLIPKRLSETFCDYCREKLPKTFGRLNNIKIQEYFLDLRNYLQDPNQNLQNDEYDQICSEILGKQPKVIGTQSIKQYSSTFLEAVTSKLGKYNENDLNEYIRLNQIDPKNAEEVEKELNNHIKKSLGIIYELTEKTAHYSLDPKYLKAISGIDNLLAQTRLYYKIHRDINKNTLVLGGDGQRNYPPGLNTNAKIFSSGANALLLGELGSYKDITEDNLHTLKNHGMRNTSSTEKSAEFRSLMQIEALRSPASILANNMFFIFLTLTTNL